MNEEIEYAQMLEIPVSTINVVKKKRKGKKAKEQVPASLFSQANNECAYPRTRSDLQASVIEQVNGKLQNQQSDTPLSADAQLFAESVNSNGNVDFSDVPERIDTTRLYAENEVPSLENEYAFADSSFSLFDDEKENDGGRYEMNPQTRAEKRLKIVLGAEFAAACALCAGIFLTNVFMPNSAINTFFRSLDTSAQSQTQTDTRTYQDFTLSNVVSDFSSAEVSLSPTGILTVKDECHVYPVADGKVQEISQNADGSYTVKISHSPSFTGVVGGLNQVYYAVGEDVKANVPLGFLSAEGEAQITMYSSGVLLNCFELTEENTLAWVQKE